MPVSLWPAGAEPGRRHRHTPATGRPCHELERLSARRDPLTGKRITKFVTFRGTKRKAEAELIRLLANRNEGGYIDPTKMTVAQWLRHCLSGSRF